jgi:hypothetical protein
VGQLLLYLAAVLTLWSMWRYLESAWPVISDRRFHVHFQHPDAGDDGKPAGPVSGTGPGGEG